MDLYSLPNINLIQIQIFLRAAKNENFSKTAQSLNITTGMVSKKIASLEETLGVLLFVRDKNKVYLTLAGKSLYLEWGKITGEFLSSIEKAKKAGARENQTLVFGVSTVTNTDRYFFPIIHSYEAENEFFNYKIEVKNFFAGEENSLLEGLKNRKYDIIFAPKFTENMIKECSELSYMMAVNSPLYAGIAVDHPLSQKEELRVEDLRNCEFLFSTNNNDNTYLEMIRTLGVKHGFQPHIAYSEIGEEALYLNVNENRILITDKFYREFRTNSVVYKKIANTESGLLMIWRKDAKIPVRNFVAYAREFFEICNT